MLFTHQWQNANCETCFHEIVFMNTFMVPEKERFVKDSFAEMSFLDNTYEENVFFICVVDAGRD